jgi:hypothetical protein
MGCKACTGVEKNARQLLKDISTAIRTENLVGLKFFIRNYVKVVKEPSEAIVNDKMIEVDSFRLNVLAFAVYTGSVKSFKYLYEKCSCSFELMTQNFAEYGVNPLTLVCKNNYIDLLKYFLPLYFRYRISTEDSKNTTLDFHQQALVLKDHSLSPIQAACLNGSIAVVDWLYNYNLASPDPLININEINEDSGENSAFLAVRSGSIAMVKLLFEKYKIDFTVKNKYEESVLQVCAECTTKNANVTYAEVFVFLVEEVGLNVATNYSEILATLRDKQLIAYTHSKLKQQGLSVSTLEFEEVFRSSKQPRMIDADCQKERLPADHEFSSIEHLSSETPFNTGSFLN